MTPFSRVSSRPCDRRLADTESTSPSLRRSLNETRPPRSRNDSSSHGFRVKTLFTNWISHVRTSTSWSSRYSCPKVNRLTRDNLFNHLNLQSTSFVFSQLWQFKLAIPAAVHKNFNSLIIYDKLLIEWSWQKKIDLSKIRLHYELSLNYKMCHYFHYFKHISNWVTN